MTNFISHSTYHCWPTKPFRGFLHQTIFSLLQESNPTCTIKKLASSLGGQVFPKRMSSANQTLGPLAVSKDKLWQTGVNIGQVVNSRSCRLCVPYTYGSV